jgi:hypothetical protein
VARRRIIVIFLWLDIDTMYRVIGTHVYVTRLCVARVHARWKLQIQHRVQRLKPSMVETGTDALRAFLSVQADERQLDFARALSSDGLLKGETLMSKTELAEEVRRNMRQLLSDENFKEAFLDIGAEVSHSIGGCDRDQWDVFLTKVKCVMMWGSRRRPTPWQTMRKSTYVTDELVFERDAPVMPHKSQSQRQIVNGKRVGGLHRVGCPLRRIPTRTERAVEVWQKAVAWYEPPGKGAHVLPVETLVKNLEESELQLAMEDWCRPAADCTCSEKANWKLRSPQQRRMFRYRRRGRRRRRSRGVRQPKTDVTVCCVDANMTEGKVAEDADEQNVRRMVNSVLAAVVVVVEEMVVGKAKLVNTTTNRVINQVEDLQFFGETKQGTSLHCDNEMRHNGGVSPKADAPAGVVRNRFPPTSYNFGFGLLNDIYEFPRTLAQSNRERLPRLRRPIGGFAAAQELPLDPIRVGRINTTRVVRIIPSLAPVIACVQDNKTFLARFKPVTGPASDDVPQLGRPLRDSMARELPALELAGIVVDIPRRSVKGTINLFKVPKNDEVARMISNCVPLNLLMERPEALHLHSPASIVRIASRYSLAADVDLRHWFDQFGICDEMRCRLAFRTEDGKYRALDRMPMGCLDAMHVGHRTAEGIGHAVQTAMRRAGHDVAIPAFVDGLAVFVNCERVGKLAVMVLLVLLRYCNAEVNWRKSHLRFALNLEFIGLNLDLKRRAYQLLQKWRQEFADWFREKTDDALWPADGHNKRWTFRDILHLCGCILWAWYARQLSMAELRPLFDTVISPTVSAEKLTWDDETVFVPTEQICAWQAEAVSDTWEPFRGTAGRRFAETDATPSTWGHVMTTALRGVMETCCGVLDKVEPIHIAEMIGAVLTIYHMAIKYPGCTLVLGIDNEVTKFVLRKGHSPCDELNQLAAEVHRLLRQQGVVLVAVRVSTDNNISDEPSRRCLRCVVHPVPNSDIIDTSAPGLAGVALPCIGSHARQSDSRPTCL